MSTTLNKSKSFGTVCGGKFPYTYTQNHKFYNAQGEEVTESGILVSDLEKKKDTTERVNPLLQNAKQK